MVVLRSFLPASRMGMATLHPDTRNRRTYHFFVLLVLSGVISYAVFSFLLFNTAPAEWSRPARYLSVCLTSWLAFSLTPFRDDSTEPLNRFGRSMMCFVGHMAFLLLVAPGLGE